MFNVISLATQCLFEVDGIVQSYPTGPDAARVAVMLTNDTGAKWQPRRAAVTTDWRERERKRFCDGVYIPVPWSTSIGDHEWGGIPEISDHFVHMSKEEPGKVAFTEDGDKGAADRQTRIRPGRYLERFFPNEYSGKREYWRAVCSRLYDPTDIRFADTENEIVRVYENGPTSCMSSKGSQYVAGHPTRIYAAGDLAVAYLVSQDDDTKITARALCWPSKKVYGRVYGDSVRLEAALGRLEYHPDTGKDFEHARLLKIEHGSGYVMPYIDYYSYCYDDGKFLKISRNDGSIETQVTNGATEVVICPHCENAFDNENEGSYVHGHGETWCDDCVENDTFRCDHDEDIYSNDTNSYEMESGEVWCERAFERHGATCEATGINVSNDDVVSLQDGRVWCTSYFERHGYHCVECNEAFEIGMRCDDCVEEDETPMIAGRDNVPEQTNFDALI